MSSIISLILWFSCHFTVCTVNCPDVLLSRRLCLWTLKVYVLNVLCRSIWRCAHWSRLLTQEPVTGQRQSSQKVSAHQERNVYLATWVFAQCETTSSTRLGARIVTAAMALLMYASMLTDMDGCVFNLEMSKQLHCFQKRCICCTSTKIWWGFNAQCKHNFTAGYATENWKWKKHPQTRSQFQSDWRSNLESGRLLK